jgi:hypothetical protein
MRKAMFPVTLTLLLVILATALPQQAQAPVQRSGQEYAKHSLAVNLLRGINTAEYEYRSRHGNFVPWDTLMASEEFKGFGMQFAASNDKQLAGVQFSNGPEILPGWALRLNLVNGGTGYDVQLEDTSDKACRWSALSDESVVLRQSKLIDCPI